MKRPRKLQGGEGEQDKKKARWSLELNDENLYHILNYLQNQDLSTLARVSRQFRRVSLALLNDRTDRVFYFTPTSHRPRLAPTNLSLATIQSEGWFFLHDIASQAQAPLAIASQSQFGTYPFHSLRTGGTNNPLTTLDTNTTVGVAKINGFFLGLFLTRAFHNTGWNSEYDHPWKCVAPYPPSWKNRPRPGAVCHNHMEDHFLEAMHRLLTDLGLRGILKDLLAQSKDGNTLVITLKGTKSPCFKCAYNLIQFVTKVDGAIVGGRKIRVYLRCKAMGIYEGEPFNTVQLVAIRALFTKGIALIPWAIVQRAGKAYTKRGLSHEFTNWQEDWKNNTFREQFKEQQTLKKDRFFNLDKKLPFRADYVELREILFGSMQLYRQYGTHVNPPVVDDEII